MKMNRLKGYEKFKVNALKYHYKKCTESLEKGNWEKALYFNNRIYKDVFYRYESEEDNERKKTFSDELMKLHEDSIEIIRGIYEDYLNRRKRK